MNLPRLLRRSAPSVTATPQAADSVTSETAIQTQSAAQTEEDFWRRQQAREIEAALPLYDGFHLILGLQKTGTSAAEKALRALGPPGCKEKIHFISEALLLLSFQAGDPDTLATTRGVRMRELKRHWTVRADFDLYRKIQAGSRARGKSVSETRPHVIVTLREPTSRFLSNFFYMDFEIHRAVTVTPEQAQQAMLARYVMPDICWWEMDRWINSEIRDEIGVDLMAQPFDSVAGWQIYETDDVRLLVIRQENFTALASALGAFYGIAPGSISVPHSNVGEKNAYGDAYGEARKMVRLPADLLEEIYSHRYARHFYTEQEHAKFIARWRSN